MFQKLLITLLVVVCSACSFGPQYEYEVVKPDTSQYKVEVETIEDQALKAINATKTEFFVPIGDESAAWDRAKLFYIKYLKIDSLTKIEKLKTNKFSTLSNASLEDQKYVYEVKKELFGNGFNYKVASKPGSPKYSVSQANRNAKNLARFIQEGTLETSLLK